MEIVHKAAWSLDTLPIPGRQLPITSERRILAVVVFVCI